VRQKEDNKQKLVVHDWEKKDAFGGDEKESCEL